MSKVETRVAGSAAALGTAAALGPPSLGVRTADLEPHRGEQLGGAPLPWGPPLPWGRRASKRGPRTRELAGRHDCPPGRRRSCWPRATRRAWGEPAAAA